MTIENIELMKTILIVGDKVNQYAQKNSIDTQMINQAIFDINELLVSDEVIDDCVIKALSCLFSGIETMIFSLEK